MNRKAIIQTLVLQGKGQRLKVQTSDPLFLFTQTLRHFFSLRHFFLLRHLNTQTLSHFFLYPYLASNIGAVRLSTGT
jgi:hypothetical protein